MDSKNWVELFFYDQLFQEFLPEDSVLYETCSVTTVVLFSLLGDKAPGFHVDLFGGICAGMPFVYWKARVSKMRKPSPGVQFLGSNKR